MAVKKADRWDVKDYYTEEKTLAMDGAFADDSMKIQVGMFYEYYPNTQMKSRGRYVEGKPGYGKNTTRTVKFPIQPILQKTFRLMFSIGGLITEKLN